MKSVRDYFWVYIVKLFYKCIVNFNSCVFLIVRRDYENIEMKLEE